MLIRLLVAWAGAYVLGSIPSGIFWTWITKRIDIRQHGSGRTGGTNVWRTAGFWPAFLTAVSDGVKGAAGVWLAKAFGLTAWGIAIAGTLTVVGHNYSLFLKFRGGAGTGTSIGVASVLWVWALPILVALGVVVGLLVGHASVGSILIALALPVIFLARNELPNWAGFGIPTMLLTIWALRPNIDRLCKRAERFLPIYLKKPPLIRLSRHPSDHR
ncbi:MAG: glycerol-3-phosphate acyltransferase [Anaerolineae bacterium]|nr:glycerol-3-phosphate acyltransferase [Anaerolineae bacterium]